MLLLINYREREHIEGCMPRWGFDIRISNMPLTDFRTKIISDNMQAQSHYMTDFSMIILKQEMSFPMQRIGTDRWLSEDYAQLRFLKHKVILRFATLPELIRVCL